MDDYYDAETLLRGDVVAAYARRVVAPGHWWGYPESPGYDDAVAHYVDTARHDLTELVAILKDWA